MLAGFPQRGVDHSHVSAAHGRASAVREPVMTPSGRLFSVGKLGQLSLRKPRTSKYQHTVTSLRRTC